MDHSLCCRHPQDEGLCNRNQRLHQNLQEERGLRPREHRVPVVFSVGGQATHGIAAGSKVLFANPIEGGSEQASLRRRITNHCGKVRDQFSRALTFVERYTKSLSEAKDAADVDKKTDGEGEGKASEETHVNEQSCNLEEPATNRPMSFDEFRNFLRNGTYHCYPEAVIEAVVQHERTHMKQCIADPAFAQPTRERLSQYETQAYCVEARTLLKSLEDCGGASPEDTARYRPLCPSTTP